MGYSGNGASTLAARFGLFVSDDDSSQDKGQIYWSCSASYLLDKALTIVKSHAIDKDFAASSLAIPDEDEDDDIHRQFFVASKAFDQHRSHINAGYINDEGNIVVSTSAYLVIYCVITSFEIGPSTIDRCYRCSCLLDGTPVVCQLSQRARRLPESIASDGGFVCAGYQRLFSAVPDERAAQNTIHWIMHGQPLDTMPPRATADELLALCKRRRNEKKKRAKLHYRALHDSMVTTIQLYNNMVKAVDFNCCLVGSPMVMDGFAYNGLTFDHICALQIIAKLLIKKKVDINSQLQYFSLDSKI
ncbi:hypothetical protein MBANPS3_008503 [Mucor bainieri]